MTRMVSCFLAVVTIALVGAEVASAAETCPKRGCKEDMTIWGHAVRQPIYRDENSELKFTIKNNGPNSATGVWIQAVVPAGLRILGTKLYGGQSCYVKGTFVKCQMGDYVNQQEGTLLIDVRGDTLGTWITEADVYSTDGKDTSGGNGQVRATLMVKEREGGTSNSAAQTSWPDGSYGTPPPGLSLAARMRARYEKLQHVVRDGGVRITMRVPHAGSMLVGGKVRVGNGFVKLATVSRRHVTTKRAWPIWLGTTSEERARLKAALQRHESLPARVWVRYKDETIRYDLRVTR